MFKLRGNRKFFKNAEMKKLCRGEDKLKNNIAAMITPYKEDGSVALETAARYVVWYAQKGCTGIFSLGSAAEVEFLTLDERTALQQTIWAAANEFEKATGSRPLILASGHVSGNIEKAAEELNSAAAAGTDVLVIDSGRIASANENWIENAEKLIECLPESMPLGLYGCPADDQLRWCISTGRFRYIIDTGCDFNTIAEHAAMLEGSGAELLNSNSQTLLDSLVAGAGGYCGEMANFHPQLYAWICENSDKLPQQAAFIQSIVSTAGLAGANVKYPLGAKYHMCLEGIPTSLKTRCPGENVALNDYDKSCIKQLKFFTDVVSGGMLG